MLLWGVLRYVALRCFVFGCGVLCFDPVSGRVNVGGFIGNNNVTLRTSGASLIVEDSVNGGPVTSQSFAPLQEPRSCGGITLAPGTRAAQWLVSPAGSLVCQAVAHSAGWWWQQAELNRRQLYRHCTDNLRLEARNGFSRSAHQLGRRDYCAEERALLARDRIRAQ